MCIYVNIVTDSFKNNEIVKHIPKLHLFHKIYEKNPYGVML